MRHERGNLRDVWIQQLSKYDFDYFVTLATNHRVVSARTMKQFLRQWDAHANRAILGRHWQKREDERLVWFAFLEKPETNPHWHLLVSLEKDFLGPSNRRERSNRFPQFAEESWLHIVTTGTVDVQPVRDANIERYVTKNLDAMRRDHYIFYREFFTTG